MDLYDILFYKTLPIKPKPISDGNLKEFIEATSNTLVIPKGTTSIRNGLLRYDVSTNYIDWSNIGRYDSLTINDYAFQNSSLLEVVIPYAAKTTGSHICGACKKLTKAEWQSGTSIPTGAFNGCSSLTEFNIVTASKISISNNAFGGCTSLKTLTIPDNIVNIGNAVFSGCKNISYLNLGSGIKTIGSTSFAFNNTTGTTTLIFNSKTPPTIQTNTFILTNSNIKYDIYVPDAFYDSYITATNWTAVNTKFPLKKISEL